MAGGDHRCQRDDQAGKPDPLPAHHLLRGSSGWIGAPQERSKGRCEAGVTNPARDRPAFRQPGEPEPGEANSEENEVEEVGERLRREVVLPDPIADEEEPDGEPKETPVGGKCPKERDERCEEEEVEEDRRPRGKAERALEAGQFREECRKREEPRPVVVGGEVADVGIDASVAVDVIDDPDVLPRP